jgi:hypothetical protein
VLVLVRHGAALCLTGDPPDLGWWARLAMPDVTTFEAGARADDMLAP